MIMLAVAIHLFVSEYGFDRRDVDYWFFLLTTVLFFPHNIFLSRMVYRNMCYLCEGMVSAVSLIIIIGLFFFSIEQIGFGILHQLLKRL